MAQPALMFALGAAVLVVLATLPLVRSLLRPPKVDTETPAAQANLGIFRQALRDLESEFQEGKLSQEDLQEAREELQKRLLEDMAPGDTPPAPTPARSRTTAFALLALIPLGAFLLYGVLGTPAALDPANRQARPAEQTVTAAQIESMVGRLAEKLKANPDDLQGWVMLGRSYKILGRYEEAAAAYGKGLSLLEGNATGLADYAETLAMARQGNLQGEPEALVMKALKLDPNLPRALLLAGVAANDRGDFGGAADYWEKLLAQMDPASDEARSVKDSIAKLREKAKAAQAAPRPPGAPRKP